MPSSRPRTPTRISSPFFVPLAPARLALAAPPRLLCERRPWTPEALSLQTRRCVHTPSACAPGAAAAAGTTAVAEGRVVEFRSSGGERTLGTAVRRDGKRNWLVRDSRGNMHSVAPKQLTYVAGEEVTGAAELEGLCKGMLQAQGKGEGEGEGEEEVLAVAWELLRGEGVEEGGLELPLIADVAFGGVDEACLYAAHVMLARDGVYFKERNVKGRVLYESRSPQLVEGALRQQEAARKREEGQSLRRNTIIQSVREGSLDGLRTVLGADAVDMAVELLKQLAYESGNGAKSDVRFNANSANAFVLAPDVEKTLVKEIMTALGRQILPSDAFAVLRAWGVFRRHENLALLKAGFVRNEHFSDSLIKLADDMITNPPQDVDAHRRRDFRALRTYAIDSADTSEVDDALSWDAENGRVLVHIADPTRYFPEGPRHPMLAEALRRVCTLYLPDKKLTMFPTRLATSLLSLDGAQSDGVALTFGFRITEDGVLDEDTISIETSYISMPIRLTYEEAEERLTEAGGDEFDDLRLLATLAKKRQHIREMDGGAIIINTNFPEVIVHNAESDEPEITLGLTRTTTKSWILVSELMITSCNVAGIIADRAKAAVPFRGQEPFDYPEDEVLESVPDGAVRASLAFRNATPSEVRTEALVHASLGVDAYVQVTSPIRRSADVVGHVQLKALIRGEEFPFTKEEVEVEINRSNDIGKTTRNIENRSKKYWQYEFLRRQGPERVYDGLFVRQLRDSDERLGYVSLEEYGFQIVASVPPGTKPGTQLNVKILDINARNNTVRAEASVVISDEEVAKLSAELDDMFSDIESEDE